MSKKERFFYRFYFLEPTVVDNELNWSNPIIHDTYQKWDIVCKSFPYDIMGESKDIPTTDWPDEDGVEFYIPSNMQLPLKSQTVSIEFVCCSNNARNNVRSFIRFVTGRDGSGSLIGIYDTYTGLSGINVVYKKFSNDIYKKVKNDKDIITFKVEFTFTEPMDMDRVIRPMNGDFNDDFNDDFLKEYI